MGVCVAINCSKRTDRTTGKHNVSFHVFPSESTRSEIRRKWIEFVSRPCWKPTSSSRLCSLHFSNDMFIEGKSRRLLREDAVPSIQSLPPVRAKKRSWLKLFPSTLKESSGSSCETGETSSVQPSDVPPGETSSVLPSDIMLQSYDEGIETFSVLPSDIMEQSYDEGIETSSVLPSDIMVQSYDEGIETFSVQPSEYPFKKIKLHQPQKICLSKQLNNAMGALREANLLKREATAMLQNIAKTSLSIRGRRDKKNLNPRLKKLCDERLRAFAITLHYLSPKAYNYMRDAFDTCLPHAKTISKWYSTGNAEPGISKEVLQVLQSRYKDNEPGLCAMMIDAMAIRQHVEYDGKKFIGHVNVGISDDCDSSLVAKEALVFHLVFLNTSWKLPVAYFFTDSCSGDQLAGLVTQCLTSLAEVNVRVVSLTCDGASANIAMANHLGCTISSRDSIAGTLKTQFEHPILDTKVFFFLDPSCMFKLVRNAFEHLRVIRDSEGRIINWKFIIKLHDLQEKIGLQLDNKLTTYHIKSRNRIIKVLFAAQLLSESVANALRYCKLQKIEGFDDVDGTIKFIEVFNKLFDILNSRSINQRFSKQPLNPKNFKESKKFLLEAFDYISGLKEFTGRPLVLENRKTGFIGFLVCIKSLIDVYEELIVNNTTPVKYLATYKFSQDHLERLFGYIRARGGCNNNPTCRQFTASFNRILIRSELYESEHGYCLPLDKINVLTMQPSPRSPITAINITTPVFRTIDNEDNIEETLNFTDNIMDHVLEESGHDYLIIPNVNDINDVTLDIVEYITGYIVRRLKSILICDECIEALTAEEPDKSGLIFVKCKGGLITPSPDVLKITKCAEKMFREESAKQDFSSNFHIDFMVNKTMRELGSSRFNNFSHFNFNDFNDNHYFNFVKCVALFYIKIRCHHYTKQFNTKLHFKKLRSKFTKLIQFKG